MEAAAKSSGNQQASDKAHFQSEQDLMAIGAELSRSNRSRTVQDEGVR
jgi:hypothetical protein